MPSRPFSSVLAAAIAFAIVYVVLLALCSGPRRLRRDLDEVLAAVHLRSLRTVT